LGGWRDAGDAAYVRHRSLFQTQWVHRVVMVMGGSGIRQDSLQTLGQARELGGCLVYGNARLQAAVPLEMGTVVPSQARGNVPDGDDPRSSLSSQSRPR